MRILKSILVTGGAGFIGSNFIHYLFKDVPFGGRVVNLDKLTYAGNLMNLEEIYKEHAGKRYFFEIGDICDFAKVESIFKKYDIDTVVHFAAESHVDRSIFGPKEFVETNITGTFSLLEAARNCWKEKEDRLFHHISTDEVFGSLGTDGFFFETTPYSPRSPYSASKAGSDHLVWSYHHTYGIPVTLSNCSNNYGRFQFPEKLIPLMILNMMEGQALPVYGDGRQVRDWLHVHDHCSAIWLIINKGKIGRTYNVGGENEWENIKLVNVLCEQFASLDGNDSGQYKKLITYVKDRPGHDRRYAINCDRIKEELGWRRRFDFENGLIDTIKWYMSNRKWVENVKSGEYRNWIDVNYKGRA